MIGRIQPSKTSGSCMLWQTSNEKNPENYVILQELPSTFRNVNEHLLKLTWLHKVLCCQEYYLLSRLLVLALSSLQVRPVDNCWAGKTFISIIKSRTRYLSLVLMHSITEFLLGENLTSDSSLESGCGFWSCSALEAVMCASCWVLGLDSPPCRAAHSFISSPGKASGNGNRKERAKCTEQTKPEMVPTK